MTIKLRFTNHKNHRDILKEYYYHNKYILTEQMKDTLLDAIECMEYVIEKEQEEEEFNNESEINNWR